MISFARRLVRRLRYGRPPPSVKEVLAEASDPEEMTRLGLDSLWNDPWPFDQPGPGEDPPDEG